MKIIVAPDSFKGSNSSLQAATLIERGIRKVYPKADIIKIPVADGGEGTVEAVITASQGQWQETAVNDPLGRGIMARWGCTKDLAVIEMAEASGLTLLKEEERNPLMTSTYGTGQLIEEALNKGYRKILIGLGGSATNDGGTGMARALGVRFLDDQGQELSDGGGDLHRLEQIDLRNLDPRIIETEITIASDVTNPLLGETGATATYSTQKGADQAMQRLLEEGLAKLADVLEKQQEQSFRGQSGAGAAGGLGFGLLAFCGARISSGIDTILDSIDFDRIIRGAAIVVTGEGRIDGQSLYGKVPVGIARRCRNQGIPVLAIVGDLLGNMDAIYAEGISSVMSTVPRAMALKEAMEQSSELLEDAAERAFRMIKIGCGINP